MPVSIKPENIVLRPVSEDDQQFLFDLYVTTREDLASVPEIIPMQFSAQQNGYRSMFPDVEHSIILVDGVPAGRFWLARLESEFMVVDIALLPQFRRSGIGGVLYRQMMADAQVAGKPVHTSVLRFNEPSLRFHERLGFTPVAEDELMLHMEWRPPA
jgi:GNAT superfamily N-acetyltransferase